VLPAGSRARHCASACTFMAAAGIYRRGAAFFHRGRRGERTGADTDPLMSDVLDRLQKAETRITAFYRKMDSGEDAIRAFQSTASETVLSAPMPMMPRYVGDYLKKKCLTQGQPKRPSKPDAEPSAAQSRGSWKTRSFPQSEADLQCVAASNTRERLAQYSKLCKSDCNLRELFHEATVRMRALAPDDKGSGERSNRGSRR